ncbi:hypothetical protein Bca4012_069434 [Brassica carinata]
MGKVSPAQIRDAEKSLVVMEGNDRSHDTWEKPELLAESPERRKRVAEDSGKTEQQVSQLVAQIFQMRVRMKNLMGVMEGGSIPALSQLEDAMKAQQKAPPGTARRKKRKVDSSKKFVESASSNLGPRGFGSGN